MPIFTSDQRVAPVTAVGRFRAGEFYRRLDNVPVGSASMTRYAALVSVKGRTPSTTSERIIDNTIAPGGYSMRYLGSGGTFAEEFSVLIRDGGGVSRQIEIPMALRPLGRLVVVAFSYDGTTLRGRTSEGATGSLVTGGGYTAPASVVSCVGNSTASGESLLSWSIAAFLGSETVARTDAQMAADITTLLENFQNGRDLGTGLGLVPGFYWDAGDVVPGGGGVTAVSWTDRVGGLVFTRVGPTEGYGHAARVL